LQWTGARRKSMQMKLFQLQLANYLNQRRNCFSALSIPKDNLLEEIKATREKLLGAELRKIAREKQQSSTI